MLTRREFGQLISVYTFLRVLPAWTAEAEAVPFLLGPSLLGIDVPRTLAGCEALRKEISALDSRAQRLASGDYIEVDELRHRMATHQRLLSGAVAEAKAAAELANTKLLINRISSGLSIALLGIGLFASSPYALGAVVGIKLLSMPAFFAWNVISLGGVKNSVFVGYTREKTLYLAELSAENVTTRAGHIIGTTLNGISLLIQAAELHEAAHDATATKNRTEEALKELEATEKALSRINLSNAVLGAFMRHEIIGIRDSLAKYVDMTSANNCTMIGVKPPTGLQIVP